MGVPPEEALATAGWWAPFGDRTRRAQAVCACAWAHLGGLISSTGCFGGTKPSGRFGLKVVQGSSSSKAQSRFLWK